MQQAPENGSAGTLAIGNWRRALPSGGCKWSLRGLFAGVLFSLLHLLNERFGLLLVGERECGGAVLEFECVEESTVLIVWEIIIDLLVPDHALPRRLQRCQYMSTPSSGNFHHPPRRQLFSARRSARRGRCRGLLPLGRLYMSIAGGLGRPRRVARQLRQGSCWRV